VSPALPLLLALSLGLIAWLAARSRAWTFRTAAREGGSHLHSLPSYHAWYVALWAIVPAVLFAAIWTSISPGLVLGKVLTDPSASSLPAFGIEREAILAEAQALANGSMAVGFRKESAALVEPFRAAMGQYGMIGLLVTLILGLSGGAFGFLKLRPDFTARTRVERFVMMGLLGASLVAVLTTLGILGALIYETFLFFRFVSPMEFLFGTHWGPDPMISPDAIRADTYGALPLFWGTVFIGAIIAMIVAIPLGLMSAIYLTQYASANVRRWMKPLLEILAGVPTVVYGYFAALTVAPWIRDFGTAIGISSASSESRAGCRCCHGHHDHTVCLLDGGRFDYCRAPGDARRQPGNGRNHVRNDQEGADPGRPARHRRGRDAGREPRDRRNHDRGHGRRRHCPADRQPVRIDDYRHFPDRRHADRRRQFRSPLHAVRLRAGDGAVPRHPDAQFHCAARRQALPGSL
jgi:hypothetical protein